MNTSRDEVRRIKMEITRKYRQDKRCTPSMVSRIMTGACDFINGDTDGIHTTELETSSNFDLLSFKVDFYWTNLALGELVDSVDFIESEGAYLTITLKYVDKENIYAKLLALTL